MYEGKKKEKNNYTQGKKSYGQSARGRTIREQNGKPVLEGGRKNVKISNGKGEEERSGRSGGGVEGLEDRQRRVPRTTNRWGKKGEKGLLGGQ